MSERLHQRIFFAVNGLGPYPCEGCEDTVTIEMVVVHHRDHDHDNNDPENLTGMHRGCHQRLHALLRKKSPVEIERLRQARLGATHTEASRQKMSAARTGVQHTEARRESIKAAMERYWLTPEGQARKQQKISA